MLPSSESSSGRRLRVLYSFPHKIGAGQICATAWHQVDGLHRAGVDVIVRPGAVHRPLPGVRCMPTLALGRLRLPYRVLGRNGSCALHDWIVARWLRRHRHAVDLVHAWPLGALRTIRTAKALGIPVALERPNAHTRFAFKVVAEECRKVGIELPAEHSHHSNDASLRIEEAEYRECDALLCPSDFVAETFRAHGFGDRQIVRHRYGYDETRVRAGEQDKRPANAGLVALYAGGCAPRKGLHLALEAWLASGAQESGEFIVCGDFVPGYREKLAPLLAHPSVRVLGHRKDLPEIMRRSDVFVLPSVEEGSALVTYEARGSGCVLAVSTAAGAVCADGVDGFLHSPGDVATLRHQLSRLASDRGLWGRLRAASLAGATELTWSHAGAVLADAYRTVLSRVQHAARE